MTRKNNIAVLIAPLDWGLGHATRCIPLIKYLLQKGCKVIIATTGIQKELLKTEFPNVIFVNIPGYQIKYTRDKRFFALKIALQVPKILIAIHKEHNWLRKFLLKAHIDAVISDNRYGLFHHKVTSVFITHQLLIKAKIPFIEKIMIKINYRFIKKFSSCWIPDEKGVTNLAGILSHPPVLPAVKLEYMGGLSRLERSHYAIKYNVLIILSGPEPQRTTLENIIIKELIGFKEKVLVVRGMPGSTEELHFENEVIVKNHLSAHDLEKVMNESDYIISRSGYTTVMDICKLRKKSILIPTPGQTEQEYLADHLQMQSWCLTVKQENFSLIKSLEEAKLFKYQLPYLKMDTYKEVLTSFINNLSEDCKQLEL